MPELARNWRQSEARGGSSLGEAKLTIEFPQQRKVTAPRFCRVTLGVDVSSSMRRHIDTVIGGIEDINTVLNDEDLISVRSFAFAVQTIFPYKDREKVNWGRLGNDLRDLVTGRTPRQDGTALWDAIVQIIQQTPRNKEFQCYKPEIIIFTDGEENRSQNNTFAEVQACLEKPGIAHVHITIIDASPRGNPQLKDVCDQIQHCSYMRVDACQEAIQRAFKTTVTEITARLEVPLRIHDTASLGKALSELTFDAGAYPSIMVEETRGESSRGRAGNLREDHEQSRSNGGSRNRGKSRAKNHGGRGGNHGGDSQKNGGKDQKKEDNPQRNGGNGQKGGGNGQGNRGNSEGVGGTSSRKNNKNGGGSGRNNAGKGKNPETPRN
ncbi:uncharacterized protein DFL_004392 [Arthrobotrys flagrans]|uniref:VWFA domain-containing protein n=1 Tax=Arthrobotrys flagrans TaxID=97331 RepID=A0A437A4P9_ARTFL|nr:hypothetical protein DFL_004392 [Arthrobotrys flagrans]